MEKAFVYGMSVAGNNFTDRIEETKRIKADFEHGINVILISPRRMGKTSLVKKVISEIDNPEIKVVYMDIYELIGGIKIRLKISIFYGEKVVHLADF